MTKCTKYCNLYYNWVEEKIGTVFSKYGRFVARHPWKIVLIGVLLNGLLGIGMIRLNVVIDVERVYTPIGSQASKDADQIRELFPDMSGTTFVSHQMPDLGRYGEVIVIPKGGDILDGTFLTKLVDLYNFILAIGTTDGNGASVTLNDICAKIHGACSVDGSLFVDTNFISDVNASNPIPFPFYTHPTQGQIYYEQLIGGAVVSPSNTLTSAKMLILRVNLRTDSDYYVDTAKNWQESFLEKIKDYSSEDFDISYSHRDSLSEELNDNIAGDIVYFSITFTVIITYACVATMTARCDVVGQKCYLGFAGVIAAGLAIVAAFGVGSAYGVEFVSIVGVVPFLIIGIGVDDMFMLMSGITNADYRSDVESRIGETMKTSGVSITITTLTDLLAFAAGASSVFLSVRNFCSYCAIAVIFCYINQATIFLASIAINEKRTEGNRHFSTCFKVRNPDVDKDKHSKCYLLCCSGRKPRDVQESESLLDKFPKWLIPKLTMSLPAKVSILVAFVIYLCVSIWGCTRLEQGLILKDLVSRDSYYFQYREYLDNNFPEGTVVSLVIKETKVYSNANVQTNIASTLSTMRAESTVQDFITISWLDSYKASGSYSDTSESAFITGLQTFLSQPANARFINDVVINNSITRITASRFYVISGSIKDSQEQGSFMLKMRDIVSDSSLPAFAFSPAFLFYEQYVVILSQTLQTLGIAVGMVFLVTCIFMTHPLLVLYVTATVAMITCGIFGFIAFLGLKLSAITMIHVIMSIGFSVDFSAHICHSYMISSGKTKNERMVAGIKRSGAPIFHGAISTILGVILLAFAKSFIFYSFFQVMSLVITFGILHALLLLPVILSLIGPSNLMGGSTIDVRDKSESINGVQNIAQELSSSSAGPSPEHGRTGDNIQSDCEAQNHAKIKEDCSASSEDSPAPPDFRLIFSQLSKHK